MSDEEVIRRRLLIDGDGTGDERRFNSLIKSVIKWTSTKNMTVAENNQMCDRMRAQLAQCEFASKRSLVLAASQLKQSDDYMLMQLDTERKIAEVCMNIEKQKRNLKEAMAQKSNRMQYDVLAEKINREPTRAETSARLEKVQAEITALRAEKQLIDEMMKKRRQQFYLLSTCVNTLSNLLAEDRKGNELLSSSPTPLDDSHDELSTKPEPMSE